MNEGGDMKEMARHYLNSLRVYAFLYPYLGEDKAARLANMWEAVVHPILYPNMLFRRWRRHQKGLIVDSEIDLDDRRDENLTKN
jgi:hypothetical protein